MARQDRLVQLPLIGTLLLCLLAGIYLLAYKPFSKPEPSDAIIKHSVDTPSEDALKHWSTKRKRSARPAPLPNVTDLTPEKQQPRRQPD